MKITRLNNYFTDENTYLLTENGTGAVIDPGYKTEGILRAASDAGVTIKYVLLTHCHYDHMEFLEELREKTGAKLICGAQCSENIGNPDINLTLGGLGRAVSAKPAEIILSDGGEFDMDGMKIKCILTPGHTSCGVCYLAGGHVFTGDTLFLRNCGRWDLPTGNEEQLYKSIREKLYTLPDDTAVHPGHGNPSTIGYEKKFNMFVEA